MASSGVTRRELVGILCTLLRDFAGLALGNLLPDSNRKSITQAPSGSARELSVIERNLAPLRRTLAEAIARLSGESAASPATQVRVPSIIGSRVCFCRGRPAVLHALKWKQIGVEEVKVIENATWANIQAVSSR
jgi:hypothetical protein